MYYGPATQRPPDFASVPAAAGCEIRVGSLGRLQSMPGCYVYVGSAHGPGGLAARVSRHQATAKKLRWHIDYLRVVTELVAVWHTVDQNRRECPWADVMSRLRGATVPMNGFGASDCDCRSHLFHFATPPNFRVFRQRVRDTFAGHAAVRCVTYTSR